MLFVHLFRMARPPNAVITFLSAYVAAYLASNEVLSTAAVLAGIGAALTAAAGNIVNDVFDIDIDRASKPHRPLPSGAVSVEWAWTAFSLSAVAALAVSCLLGAGPFTIFIVAVAGLFVYARWLKRVALVGNLLVSALAALTFFYGAAALGHATAGAVPAVFAFLFHFGREILKSLQDREADSELGARTAAVLWGHGVCTALLAAAFALLAVATILPFAFGRYGFPYLAVILIGVIPVLIYVTYSAVRTPSPANFGRLSGLLKIDMVVGLVAILIGHLGL